MPKLKKKRFCRRLDNEKAFMPTGISMCNLEEVHIELDEFEAIRLCDYEGLSQIQASEEMEVSRATIQRLLQSARLKVVDALLHYKVINVRNETHNIKLKGENNMKTNLNGELRIAFPTTNKESVDEHFGHCKFFAIYTVNDGKILSTEFAEAPAHQPGVLPKFLGELNITTIITGGMGQMAINLFKAQEIEVILGARGKIIDNLNEYLGGELDSVGTPCAHNHDEENCSH
jgi:predicted DNA-binding protein (UPF0251 family)/predicted Fe-Mo cluster-binding NifX family protein